MQTICTETLVEKSVTLIDDVAENVFECHFLLTKFLAYFQVNKHNFEFSL
jgi:hypothetical protein